MLNPFLLMTNYRHGRSASKPSGLADYSAAHGDGSLAIRFCCEAQNQPRVSQQKMGRLRVVRERKRQKAWTTRRC